MKYFLLILLLPLSVFSNSANVSGKITLEDNQIASSVKIEFISAINSNNKYEFYTDDQGNIDFTIEYGIYNITFSKVPYKTITLTEEKVNTDKVFNYEMIREQYYGVLPVGKYEFDRDIVVPFGKTLEIQAGTEIHLIGESSFNIEGEFKAIGTENSMIKIYRDEWKHEKGFIIKNNYKFDENEKVSDKVVLKYVHFEKISIYSTDNFFNNNLIIEKCKFLNDNNIFLFSISTFINNCEFRKNNINNFLIYCVAMTNFEVLNCKFVNNEINSIYKGYTIIGSYEADMNLVNCVFENNKVDEHGLLNSNYHSIFATNCFFKNNKSGENYGLMNGKVNVYNSIFWENYSDEFNRVKGLSKNKIYNCLFYKSENLRVDSEIKFFGENFKVNENGDSVDVFGNLFQDPDIIINIDDDKYDIGLNENSVCIDAGVSNALVEKYNVDIKGNKRLVDGNKLGKQVIDIGPIEHQTAFSMDVFNVKNASNFYPNPANNTISFSKDVKGKVEIYNLLGEKVLGFDANLKSAFDISNLQNGVYIIKYKIDKQFYSEKLSVSR